MFSALEIILLIIIILHFCSTISNALRVSIVGTVLQIHLQTYIVMSSDLWMLILQNSLTTYLTDIVIDKRLSFISSSCLSYFLHLSVFAFLLRCFLQPSFREELQTQYVLAYNQMAIGVCVWGGNRL